MLGKSGKYNRVHFVLGIAPAIVNSNNMLFKPQSGIQGCFGSDG